MAGLKLVLVLLVCAAVVAPLAVESFITCGQVAGKLGQCVPYLQKGVGPSPACCGGVKSLISSAKTTPDRQAICSCLKAQSGGFNPSYAASLPGKCGVRVPYPISPSTNCATIK